MGRILAFAYGSIAYVMFLGTFLYAVWSIWTMDTPSKPQGPWLTALLINAGFLSLFALQHSIMARQGFKAKWTKIVSPVIERSTFVLITNLILIGMFYFWEPLPGVIWEVQNATVAMVLKALFWVGILIVLLSTFMIDHFDLFGIKQVWRHMQGKEYRPPQFMVRSLYKYTRHPLYLGFVIAFWSTPRMTMDHLFFAVMATGYILVAIQLEERDLITMHGEEYRSYKSGVSMLMPMPRKASE